MAFEIKLTSSLEKIFGDTDIKTVQELDEISGLRGERVSFQLVCRATGVGRSLRVRAELSGPFEDTAIYEVGQVPCRLPAYEGHDANYLRVTPGMFPDPLLDTCHDEVRLPWGQCVSFWVSVTIPQDARAGRYPVKVTLIQLKENGEQVLDDATFTVRVIPVALPPLEDDFVVSQWFHNDCLATQYHVDVFSEEHWEIISRYMKNAAWSGINTIFVPLVTPPLDTAVGAERPTVQLVDITRQNGVYSFAFEKLERYIKLAQSHGFRFFELCHLYSQWGATAAPKIMATVDGKYTRLFGWDTDSLSEEYGSFLRQFLSAVIAFFRERGLLEKTLFHISDEPAPEHVDTYKKAVGCLSETLKDCTTIDALSHIEYYEEGLVKRPIPSLYNVEHFLEHGVPRCFTYYCCGQDVDVSNRFIAMPSARNRILGMQMFKYDIGGFLQWGYNFWYSQLSRRAIDPYWVTDSDCAFPSGDAFSVYPGEDGYPVASLRQVVFYEGLQDLRALLLLMSHKSREELSAWLEECAGGTLTMRQYPTDAQWLLGMREKINQEIEALFC